MDKLKSIKEYCESYFENYNRRAWLKLKETRFKQIRDNNFFLNKNVETFKNEVLKFWELKYNFENSKIRKKAEGGGWIDFQDKNGKTLNGEEIIRELNADNLKLHGNYSWSMMYRGGDITIDMEKLKGTLNYLFNDDIAIEKRFFEVVNKDGKYKIRGMSHGKASAFLHIKYPNQYGVWNNCTKGAFKILSEVNSKFKIKVTDSGEKYKKINDQLKWLFSACKKKDKNSDYDFENLSDVDIFVWYVFNNLK